MQASCDEEYLTQMGFFSCTRGMKISHSGETSRLGGMSQLI